MRHGPDDRDLALIAASPLFDAAWYGARHPDVGLSGMRPAAHYLHVGAALGRDPGPAFSSAAYLVAHPEAARAGVNPLVHRERARRGGAGAAPDVPPGAPLVDVVPTLRGAPAEALACLRALARAPTRIRHRVLLVDDAAGGATDALLREAAAMGTDRTVFERVMLPADGSAAPDAGLRAARAPYVAALGAGAIVTPFWIDALVRCLDATPGLGVAAPAPGPARAPDGEPDPDIVAANLAASAAGPGDGARTRAPDPAGPCLMIRREALDRLLRDGPLPLAAIPGRARRLGFGFAVARDAHVASARRDGAAAAPAAAACPDPPAGLPQARRILIVLSEDAGPASVRRVAAALSADGDETRLGVPAARLGALRAAPEGIPGVRGPVLPYDPDLFAPLAAGFDVLVATDGASLDLIAGVAADCPWIETRRPDAAAPPPPLMR